MIPGVHTAITSLHSAQSSLFSLIHLVFFPLCLPSFLFRFSEARLPNNHFFFLYNGIFVSVFLACHVLFRWFRSNGFACLALARQARALYQVFLFFYLSFFSLVLDQGRKWRLDHGALGYTARLVFSFFFFSWYGTAFTDRKRIVRVEGQWHNPLGRINWSRYG